MNFLKLLDKDRHNKSFTIWNLLYHCDDKGLQIVHIIVEISKFGKTPQQIESDLDKLIYIMKQSDTIQDKKQLPGFAQEDWIAQALKKVDKSKMTPEQRMWFEISMAKKGSIIEMEREERERQLEEGIVEGKKQKAIETALIMIKENMPTEKIALYTGLSIEEIEQL